MMGVSVDVARIGYPSHAQFQHTNTPSLPHRVPPIIACVCPIASVAYACAPLHMAWFGAYKPPLVFITPSNTHTHTHTHTHTSSHPSQAIDDLTTALEALPHSALLLFGRGGAQLAFAAGDVRAAAEDLQRAAEVCKVGARGCVCGVAGASARACGGLWGRVSRPMGRRCVRMCVEVDGGDWQPSNNVEGPCCHQLCLRGVVRATPAGQAPGSAYLFEFPPPLPLLHTTQSTSTPPHPPLHTLSTPTLSKATTPAPRHPLHSTHPATQGTLRGEGPLWESRKFMSSGSGTPDLSPALW